MMSHWTLKETQHALSGKLELFLLFENIASGGSHSSLCHCLARMLSTSIVFVQYAMEKL